MSSSLLIPFGTFLVALIGLILYIIDRKES